MVSIVNRAKAAYREFINPAPAIQLLPSVGEQKEYPLPLIWNMITPGRYQFSMIDYEAYAREGFSQNEVVYSAIKYKWDSISQSPLRAYKGKPSKAEMIEDGKSELALLAERPNEYMGAIQFMQYNILYLNLHGNSFIYFKSKPPYGLYPLRPDRVQIIPKEGKKGVLGYLYFPDGTSIEKAFPIMEQEMLHVKFPNPFDPLEGLGYGLPPLSAAARSVDTDNHMTRFLAEFFARNGIMGGGVIELPDVADIDDINKLREQFLETYGGSSKWGKPIVVDAGGKFVPSSMSFADMALDNIDLRNIRRTTSVFGVDGKLIGLDTITSTYSNMQEAENAFWTRVMITELRLFEEELRYKVKIAPNEFLRFDVSGIPAFSEDTSAQVLTYTSLVQNFVPPNVAAQIAGLDVPPLEGGDESYMPVGLTPVKIALNPPEPEPMGNAFGGEEEAPKEEEGKKPAPEEAEKAIAIALNQGRKIKRWSFETKDKVADSQDKIAHKYEPHLAEAALKRFQADQAETLRLFRKAQKSANKNRKGFDWNDFENSIRFYLFVNGQQEWSWEFIPWFIELAWDARDDWMDKLALREAAPYIDFDLIFLSRASIEGEAWFADYVLKFARSINTTTSEGIHAVIRDGLEQGYGTDKIGHKLQLLFDQYMTGGTSPEDWEFMSERMPPYRVEMIARTETHGAMSAANNSFFKRTGATHREWWATGDDRTRDSHLQAWNRYSEGGTPGPIPFNEDFIVGGASMRYPGDKAGPLREFINCFPPETIAEGKILGASKVWYTGKLRELVTSRGYRLSLTPNHPVLTSKGWIKACELKEGDRLLSYAKETRFGVLGDIDNQQKPSRIEDIFKTFSANGTLSIPMVLALDFDGDGTFCEGQIDIVGMDGILPLKSNSQFPLNHSLDFEFVVPNGLAGVLIEANRPANASFNAIGSPTRSFPSGLQLTGDGGGLIGNVFPLNPLCIGTASQFDTVLGKKSRDNASIALQFLSELTNASASQISFDNLVSIREYDFSGHVYDLQAVDGWIVTENIVTSNCRCVEIPFYPEGV